MDPTFRVTESESRSSQDDSGLVGLIINIKVKNEIFFTTTCDQFHFNGRSAFGAVRSLK
jgi:hypothetical protein